MAIGFSLPGIPGQIRGTAEEAGAVPDLGQAMMQGFRSNLENIQGAPRLLAQKLVSNQLANTINRAKAKYAEPMAKTSYDRALADLQNQNLVNQYYGRMRESELASAGLSQAHQRMANQYYPDLIKSKLSGAALTQDQQRMVNEQLRRDMAIKQAKQDIIQKALARGANIQQATQLAEEQTQNLPSISEIAQSPEMRNYMTALQQGVAQQPQMQEAAGYTPIPEQENIFAPEYGQGYDTGSFYDQQMLEALRQNAIAQELSPYMQVQPVSPSMIQPRGFTPKPQELPELQTYADSLAQAAPSYLAQPEVAQEQAPRSYAEQLKQQGYNTDRIIPELAALDDEYIRNPAVRDEIEKQYPGTGIKREKDFPRDRFITTTTLPSGATKTEIQSLGGGESGGELSFKAASPRGKVFQDIENFEKAGNLDAANDLKQSLIENSTEKYKLPLEKLFNLRDRLKAQNNLDDMEKVNKAIDKTISGKNPLLVQLPKGGEPVFNDNGDYVGYNRPLTAKEQDRVIGRKRFEITYPYINQGFSSYRGTPSEVISQIDNDVRRQDFDKDAADRLYNFSLGLKLLTTATASELQLINAPKVKQVMKELKMTLGDTGLPNQVENFISSHGINRDIQNRASTDFGNLQLMSAQEAEQEALKPIFIPSTTNTKLKNNIQSGAKTNKPKKIKMLPNAQGKLEIVNG